MLLCQTLVALIVFCFRNVPMYFQREAEKRWLSIFPFHFWVCYFVLYSRVILSTTVNFGFTGQFYQINTWSFWSRTSYRPDAVSVANSDKTVKYELLSFYVNFKCIVVYFGLAVSCALKVKKVKAGCSSSWESITELWGVTCYI